MQMFIMTNFKAIISILIVSHHCLHQFERAASKLIIQSIVTCMRWRNVVAFEKLIFPCKYTPHWSIGIMNNHAVINSYLPLFLLNIGMETSNKLIMV